jgi:putative ATP-dependent endonuclease of OLD family
MRIKRVKIRNYRCLEDAEICFSDITTLIGPNGAGKSSVLRALDWFFNGGKTSSLTEDDVRVGADPRRIALEAEFGDLTAEDHHALGVLAGAAGDRVIIGRSWETSGEAHWIYARTYPLFAEVRAAAGAMEKRERYRELTTDHPELGLPSASSAAAVDQALRAWEADHPDTLEDRQVPCPALFGFAGQAKLSGLFDFVFVSADLRADEESRDVKSSIIGRILEQAIDRTEADEELAELGRYMADQHAVIRNRHYTEQLNDLSGRLTGAVAELTRGRMISVRPVIPEFRPPPVQFEVMVADGPANTRVDQQGHGFRRALLISALRLLAQSTAASGNRVVCLAIEEPELFQHPVQARTFAAVLRKLAQERSRGVQVTYATHSPFFLEAEGFDEVRRFTREADASGRNKVVVRSTSRREVERRLAGTRQPEQVSRQLSGVFLGRLPEALFADAVILVEGPTDQAILEGVALRDDPLNASGIVVVDVGGKDSIPLPHAILRELGVPSYVVFDGDAAAGDRAAARGGSRERAEQSVIRDNRRILRYLEATIESHPPTQVTERYAVLRDTLEPFLEAEWPEWVTMRDKLIQQGLGLPGKHGPTYRLAAIRAAADPPDIVAEIIRNVRMIAG